MPCLKKILANSRPPIGPRLPDEGVLVLGIRREEGTYLGTPTAQMEIHAGDVLVLYGPIHRIEELDQRRKGRRGEAAHQEAMEEQVDVVEEQQHIEEQLEERRDDAGEKP